MSRNKNDDTGREQSGADATRREFLKKAGKLAVYTPPTVMLLSKPSFAVIAQSYTGDPRNRLPSQDEIGIN